MSSKAVQAKESHSKHEHDPGPVPPEPKAEPTKAMIRPTVGRIVLYTLTDQDCGEIERRRTTRTSIKERMAAGTWPSGVQAHMGNPNAEGDIFPLLVTRIKPDAFGPGNHGVNGQVFLDGNDCLWVVNVAEGSGPGRWAWPARI